MIKKVGKNTILILVTNIANGIYALSFLFRISVSIWLLVDHDSIVHLQCVSCMNNTAGFATLTFMKHFICELLPLSAIFTLQLFTIRKAKHAKLRNTGQVQGSSLTNSIDENEVLNDHSFLLSPGNDLGNVNATAMNSKRSKSNEGQKAIDLFTDTESHTGFTSKGGSPKHSHEQYSNSEVSHRCNEQNLMPYQDGYERGRQFQSISRNRKQTMDEPIYKIELIGDDEENELSQQRKMRPSDYIDSFARS